MFAAAEPTSGDGSREGVKPVPGSSENGSTVDLDPEASSTLAETLRRVALSSMIERSNASMALYPFLVGAAGALAPPSGEQSVYFWAVLTLNVLVTALRFGLNRRLDPNSGRSGRLWFAGGVLFQMLAWGAFTGPTIYSSGTGNTSLLVLMMVAGIGTGALTAYSPDPKILRMHILLNLLPVLLGATLAGNGFLLGVFLLFAFVLFIQSHYHYEWFLKAVTNNYELVRSREELERYHSHLEALVSKRTSALTRAVSDLNQREQRIRLQNEELARASAVS